jgi:Domain of unknown function (DUF4276)
VNCSTPRRITLLAEGSSDAALLPIISWLWEQHFPNDLIELQFADLSSTTLGSKCVADRLPHAIDLFPSEILLIHRDADREPPQNRRKEIEAAIKRLPASVLKPRFIFVIPVRMSEAWMLTDVSAIRKAAGNPNGKKPLVLPQPNKIEGLPDPKKTLYNLLTEAKELGPQRRASFHPQKAALLVTGHSKDFSILRRLPSFQKLEAEISKINAFL